jgi:hypothetical protein
MSGLTFAVDGALAVPFAAVPTIAFRLRVANLNGTREIQSIALRCQILIEASRRQYKPLERERLRDLFDEPERWSQTLRSMLWTHASVTVPAFAHEIACELPVACTFDFNVGAAKYFHAIQSEDVPLCFQFSGTIFYATAGGPLQIDQVDWNREAKYRLPSQVWREMMDHYYPDSAWLRLRRDAFERLYEYKRHHGMVTWEEAIESLLPLPQEAAS